MKIFIYILFFLIFLIMSAILIGLLIRSINFLIASIRILKSKFTSKQIDKQIEPLSEVVQMQDNNEVKEMESV